MPPNLSWAGGPSPQLTPFYLKASHRKRKPSRDPRRRQPVAFQRLRLPTERRLQSIFILMQKKQTYLASHRGRNDSAITCRTARERAPTGEELPGLSMVLGSPARLLHREKGSSCKLIKQEIEWVTGRGICQHNLIFSTRIASQGSHLFISQWGKEPVACLVGFVFRPNVLLKKIPFYWNWSYLSVAIKNLWNYDIILSQILH